MSNICTTSYLFHGEESELIKFSMEIDRAIAMCPIKSITNDWLGALLYASYIKQGKTDSEAKRKLMVPNDCSNWNGCISSIEMDSQNNLNIITETSRIPTPHIWELFINAFNFNIWFSYIADEYESGLHEVYDPNGEDWKAWQYVVRCYFCGEDKDFFGEKYNGMTLDPLKKDSLKSLILEMFKLDRCSFSLEALIQLVENYRLRDKKSYLEIIKYNHIESYNLYKSIS